MTNQKHLKRLNQGNKWRQEHPEIQPDLSGAILFRSYLCEVNLSAVDASLHHANLAEASLVGASLIRTELTGANLWRADLRNANLSGADLGRASLAKATLVGTNLNQANLTRCSISSKGLRKLLQRGFLKSSSLSERTEQQSTQSISQGTCPSWHRQGRPSSVPSPAEEGRRWWPHDLLVGGYRPCIRPRIRYGSA